MGVTISGMTGAGSIRHNNRSFSAANVDRSRTEQNIVFCNEDLKQVYHMVFDEALAAYNAKKTKTRDKIPDYYEHIRQSKQEKLFHEAIFQIGNMSDCGCGTPDGERAAAALKDFAESFAERNPHLRVFNMVLHMDEATPHLHVDFIPVATEQSRGLSTRVSMKQALKQQGFVGVGRKQTEWAAWMEREKEALTEIAQRHDFEIISLGTNRPHMDLPQFKEAAARLEAVQQQTAAVEREVAELERQRDALKGTVRLLKEADRVNAPLHDIQPEKTLTGAVKGVTVDQVEQLKKMALRSVTDRHKVQELTEENTRLRSQVPSMKKRLEEAQRQQRLEQENRRLRDENYYLQSELQEERSFTERLTDGIGRMLDFLEDIDDGVEKMKALEKQIEDEHGVYPCMAWDNNYRELELEELKKIVSEEEARKMQERAAKFADKEIRRKTYQAMEALIHNLNTMHSRAGAQVPFSSINYGTDTSPEGRLVMESIMLTTEAGLGNGETPIFPIQIFKVKEGVSYNPEDPNYDLFKLACRVSAKRLFPNFSFLDAPFNKQYYVEGDPNTECAYMGCRTRVIGNTYDPTREIVTGRGNLSFTSVNLPRLAIKAKGDLDMFFEGLDHMIDIACDRQVQDTVAEEGKELPVPDGTGHMAGLRQTGS